MMKRDTLYRIRKAVRDNDTGGEYVAVRRQDIYALIDHGLAMLDKVDGGPDFNAQQRDVRKQVLLALQDVGLLLAYMQQMLNAKGPQWLGEWQFYRPRAAEELSPDKPVQSQQQQDGG
jgi:hypothetical protein